MHLFLIFNKIVYYEQITISVPLKYYNKPSYPADIVYETEKDDLSVLLLNNFAVSFG